MLMNGTFESSLHSLDLGLFQTIPSQLSDADKRSLLAVQKGVSTRAASYTYLEIGSHLGGSIQPHLRDPRCSRIYSIDPRPETVADDRGETILYPKNSSAHMLDLLRGVQGDRIDRISVFDTDARQVPASVIDPRPDICFIDGEHTDQAARSDYAFCRPLVAENGVIVFHDANIIYLTLQEIVRDLEAEKARFTAYVLPSAVFVIEFGPSALHDTEDFRMLLRRNADAYFYGLESMEHYRAVYNRPGIKFVRDVYRKFGAIRRKFGK